MAETANTQLHYKDLRAQTSAMLGDDNTVYRLIQDIYGTGSDTPWDLATTAATMLAVQKAIAKGGQNKVTYSVGGAISPAATPSDVVILNGSASKSVRITRVEISMSATAAGIQDVALVRRSAVNTGGTATTPTPVPHISTDAAASAVLSQYSANPTTGATVGTVREGKLAVSASGGLASVVWEFPLTRGKGLTLTGVAQGLAINFGGAALLTGEVLAYSIEWIEE